MDLVRPLLYLKSYLTDFHQLRWLHHVLVETENLHTSRKICTRI